MKRSTDRRGFTLIEVLMSLAILSIAGIGLVGMLSESGQQNYRRLAAVDALRLARNEAQRALTAPAVVPGVGSTYRMNADGTPNTAGVYRARVQAQLWCDALSSAPDDRGGAPAPACRNHTRILVNVDFLEGGTTWRTLATYQAFAPANEPQASTWSPAGGT